MPLKRKNIRRSIVSGHSFSFVFPMVVCITIIFTIGNSSAQIIDSTKNLPGDSTIQTFKTDTSFHHRKSKDTLDAPVHHRAKQSEWIDAATQRMFLLDSATISYKDINLAADSIVFDMQNRIVYSYGRTDSAGKKIGLPVFKQGNNTYTADEIAYDFKTGKGRIVKVTTTEGEGFIHSAVVKRFPDNTFYGLNNEYTTCNRDDPDYYILSNKIKVIPGRAVVTGPANLVIEGVRTPLFLPFGIFPLADKRKSGIIIPTYGSAANLGFYLRGLGYYFGISDHLDASLTGDIYSYGSWGLNTTINYLKRYKFSLKFAGSYQNYRTFDPETDLYTSTPQYRILATFAQDSKARPNSRFQGTINISSALYDQTYGIQPQTFLTNTYQSSISYSGSFPRTPFTYSLSLSHNQNVATHQLSLQLPVLNLTMNQINPFKSSISSGRPKWYENIGISYRLDGQNNLNTVDSTLFQPETWNKFVAGFQHNVQLVAPFSLLKHINFSPNATYTETWSISTIRQQWNPDINAIQTDTVHQFAAVRNFNVGIGASTIIYGIVQFKHGAIRAIRHVLTPSIGFSYHPDFSQPQWNAFKTVQFDSVGKTKAYSIFSSSPYFGPSAGKFGGLNFSLNNNLEMKVRSEKDTVSGLKKITLIDALTLSMSYNFAVDSFRLSPLALAAHTTLFNKFQITYAASFDPYATDTAGNRINVYEWEAHRKLLRMTNTSISLSGTINSPNSTSALSKANTAQQAYIVNSGNDFVDFNIPWSISPNYTLNIQRVNKSGGQDSLVFSQALGLTGNFNLTQKWKINYSASYDFIAHQVSYVYLSIVRDLHCWTMAISANPFGPRAGFSLTIQVQASILQDLRIPLRKGYENEFGY